MQKIASDVLQWCKDRWWHPCLRIPKLQLQIPPSRTCNRVKVSTILALRQKNLLLQLLTECDITQIAQLRRKETIQAHGTFTGNRSENHFFFFPSTLKPEPCMKAKIQMG